MATTKALELGQFGTDLTVDENAPKATYAGTLVGSDGYENLPTAFTVFGRSSNINISVSNGTLVVASRAGNVNVGIS